MKKCPFCAEEIQDEAIKCRHCGEMVHAAQSPAILEPAVSEPSVRRRFPAAGLVLGVIGAVIFVLFAVGFFNNGKVLAGFSGIGAGAVFLFVAPVAWAVGDAFRRFAHPSMYFAKGAIDLAGKRLFWRFGPQLIAVAIGFGGLLYALLYLGGV